MRPHWRRLAAGFFAAVAVALSAGPLAGLGAGTALAVTTCPHGTHWDDAHHACV